MVNRPLRAECCCIKIETNYSMGNSRLTMQMTARMIWAPVMGYNSTKHPAPETPVSAVVTVAGDEPRPGAKQQLAL
jgi:hypothetical protein